MTRIGVLLSGSGTNLQALIDACAEPDFPAEIALVISNKEEAYGLERARMANLPAMHIPHRGWGSRSAYEDRLSQALREAAVDWVLCAGFMRILSPTFLDAWPQRVLNIHPALLPAFPGVDGQGQAMDYGVRIAGATVHFVDSGTDTGPIIAQAAVPVLPGDDRDTLQARILAMEHALYPMCLRMAAEGRLQVVGRKVTVQLQPGESLLLWGHS
ncbi:MAG: phosphoribosylglycinamide formyltransferase [Myxococcota bacterium]|nr:phosphoribosylglycinamide formyltransferase [Myxococcota bacterium]